MLKVYYIRFSDTMSIPEMTLLDKVRVSTREEVMLFKNEKNRRLKCLGEAMACELIETLWHLHPDDYSLVKGEHGKPLVSHCSEQVFYNISHSGDYLVCALSDREIGIDIQKIGTFRPQIVERFFHQREIMAWQQCAEAERADFFFNCWAAKESFVKYLGTGLSGALAEFEIRFEGERISCFKPDLQPAVYLQFCPIDDNYKCIVCSEYPDKPEIQAFVLSGVYAG